MNGSEAPLASVCIPVFNGENYIRESIHSVLNQTEKDFELIIVDNCSTDRTVEIVASYNDPRLNLVKNSSNMGSIRNFNRCIELSRGVFFVLLPHDDILLPTMLETFSKPLISDPNVGLVYSSYNIIVGNGKPTHLRMVALEDKIMSSEEAIKEFILHGNPVQCAMVRRELFSSLGLFDPDLLVMTDIDMWSRIALSGKKVAYFKTPQNCVRVHPGSGQRAFIKPDEHSLGTIADHLGYSPTPAYIKNNTFHLLALRYLQTLFERIPSSSDLQKLRAVSTNRLILRSLVKNLISCLILGNWTDVKQDIDLLAKMSRWAGVSKMILELLSIPTELIGRLRRRILS
ncbi:glycosyltransferase [bacterium]|nr:MAG: glycosyltransferase [bacterium]